MELEDLDQGERLVLVASLQLTIMADGRATPGEAAALDAVIARIGQARYDEAFEQASRQVRDLASFETVLPTVTREEARELIYGTVLETTLADSTGLAEEPLLESMARAWNIQVEIGGTPDDVPDSGNEPDPVV